jgi:hypothetical protein
VVHLRSHLFPRQLRRSQTGLRIDKKICCLLKSLTIWIQVHVATSTVSLGVVDYKIFLLLTFTIIQKSLMAKQDSTFMLHVNSFAAVKNTCRRVTLLCKTVTSSF